MKVFTALIIPQNFFIFKSPFKFLELIFQSITLHTQFADFLEEHHHANSFIKLLVIPLLNLLNSILSSSWLDITKNGGSNTLDPTQVLEIFKNPIIGPIFRMLHVWTSISSSKFNSSITNIVLQLVFSFLIILK